jgi:hypothetical protein
MNTPNKLLVGGILAATVCLLARIMWGATLFDPALLYAVGMLVINLALLSSIVCAVVGGVWSLVAATRRTHA